MCCGIVWTGTPGWIPHHFSQESVWCRAPTDTRLCFLAASVESVVHFHHGSAADADQHSRHLLVVFMYTQRDLEEEEEF